MWLFCEKQSMSRSEVSVFKSEPLSRNILSIQKIGRPVSGAAVRLFHFTLFLPESSFRKLQKAYSTSGFTFFFLQAFMIISNPMIQSRATAVFTAI